MKFKLFLCVFSVLALNAKASLIDYVVDNDTNIVTNTQNGLEWLRWDVTDGLSVNDALTLYSGLGWSLATTEQITQLYNDASAGSGETWIAGENPPLRSEIETTFVGGIPIPTETTFDQLFGVTLANVGFDSVYGSFDIRSSAFYAGSTSDSVSVFSIESFGEVYYTGVPEQDEWLYRSVSEITINAASPTFNDEKLAVALTRTISVTEPNTIVLFAIVIVGIGAFRRQII